jgi:hypothetical protein
VLHGANPIRSDCHHMGRWTQVNPSIVPIRPARRILGHILVAIEGVHLGPGKRRPRPLLDDLFQVRPYLRGYDPSRDQCRQAQNRKLRAAPFCVYESSPSPL